MKKIITCSIIIILILGTYLMYSETDSSSNRVTLNVSSEGPMELKTVIQDIKTHDYYKGYDNETLKWMESLGCESVYFSSDEIVIMSPYDAGKLHSEYATDVSIHEIFTCEIVEKHSLGKKDVLYVKNVKFVKQEIHYPDV